MQQEGYSEEESHTRGGISKIGDIRTRISKLEERNIPARHEDFEDLREEIHILLDHLLLKEKIDLETSHLIRTKLRRIGELFVEMAREGHYSQGSAEAEEQMDFDKERHDSKLEVVQLMLSQVFPRLKALI